MPRLTRLNSDEKYVLDLVAELLNEEYIWQKKFDTLLGDAGKNGAMRKLPVDAYFPQNNIIVEYREKQHSQSVAIMDRRMTVSGVPRGEQRKIYDSRKENWAVENNIKFMAILFSDLSYSNNDKLLRNKEQDSEILKRMINKIIVNTDESIGWLK